VIGFFIFPFSKKTKRSGKSKNLTRKKIGKNGRENPTAKLLLCLEIAKTALLLLELQQLRT